MNGNTFRPFGGGPVAIVGTDDHQHDATCFADDVVVDFPSVLPAIDRMRRAFVADDRGEPLRAALRVSADDARAGARLPIEVPVRCTCRSCGGRGGTWAEPCRVCGGQGVELHPHQVQVALPAGVADGSRFHFTVIARHNPPTRIELEILVA